MTAPCAKTKSYTNPVDYAAQIITEYEDFIRSVIRLHIKNKISEDDLFQDFFLSLVARPIPTSIEDIKSYIYKAILHDVADSNRKKYRYMTNIKKYCKKNKNTINKNNPADALIEEEEINSMCELIKEQSSSSGYNAIILRYRDGYSIQRVAEEMGVKNTSVRRYISVGLNRVRKYLTNA
jgi:RNA polymerase sigma factor (sigma-70 family)